MSEGGVQSVDRAAAALEILGRDGSAGVTDIAAELGVHKSTASRLLAALEARALVTQTAERGKYRLGAGLLRLAATVRPPDLDELGRDICRDLADTLGETVNLAVRRTHYVVNVVQARGPASVATQNWIGQLTPLHATSSGKVLLAELPDGEVRALLDAAGLTRFTAHTVTGRRALRAELAAIRAQGYALTVEEYEDGLNALSVPVRDDADAVVLALSVSGPAYRLDPGTLRDLVPQLQGTAKELAHAAPSLAG